MRVVAKDILQVLLRREVCRNKTMNLVRARGCLPREAAYLRRRKAYLAGTLTIHSRVKVLVRDPGV